MRWLLFLSRLAFICGIFFLLAISLLIKQWTKDGELTSTIITIGVFMGMLIVPVTLLCYLGVVIFRKKLTAHVPVWLIVSNILFLFAYLIYLIGMNAQNNYPA